MRILLIGATGLLGKVLLQEWRGDHVTGANSRDVDIRDQAQVIELLERCRPDWTILTAAYTDVDGCEKDPEKAHQVNCVGAVNVAQAARNTGSALFFISTDYVFDGSKTAPYEPGDIVSPMNVYGRSKAEAEEAIRKILPRHCILRTSWLFGANGRCFPNTILQLAQDRKKLSVVADQVGRPTFNRDLARTIAQLVRADATGTLHACNAGPCSWYEFAREVVQVAGMTDVIVEPVATDAASRPARRPKYSVLSTSGLDRYGLHLRSWQDTLADYFSDRLDFAKSGFGGATPVEVAGRR